MEYSSMVQCSVVWLKLPPTQDQHETVNTVSKYEQRKHDIKLIVINNWDKYS